MRSIAYIHIPFLYATAHAKLDPSLGGKPIAVTKKNTVMGVSPQALAAGVAPGTTRRHARQACPEIVFTSYDPDSYSELASTIWDICAEYTPLIEPTAPDGAFADFTGCGSAQAIADAIMHRAKEEAGVSVSIGLAGSRFVAKAATPEIYDAGTCRCISAEAEQRFLDTLPVSGLWPIPLQAIAHLEKLGIKTLAQLRKVPLAELTLQLGEAGLMAHQLSCGIDRSRVRAAYPEESIECSMSFESPVQSWPDLVKCIAVCSSKIASRLRNSGKSASWAEISLEFAGSRDSDGDGNRSAGGKYRRRSFRCPTDSAYQIAHGLERMIEGRISAPITAINVRVGGLVVPEEVQLSIFGPSMAELGKAQMGQALQYVRERFGAESVITANMLIVSRRDRMLAESLL
ncbi:MAG: DNA polymerase Y family protein [Bacillota bacterium]|jgi:DNA polymerase-4